MKAHIFKLSLLCLIPLFLNGCDDKPVVKSDYQKSAEFDSILDKFKDDMENYSLTERTVNKLKTLEEKCSKDDLKACESLYRFYSSDKRNIGNPQKASDLSYKLCKAGDPNFCIKISNHYQEGRIYEKNQDKANEYLLLARKFYEKQCKEGNSDVCVFALDNTDPEVYKKNVINLCEQDNLRACYIINFDIFNKFKLTKDESSYYNKKVESIANKICGLTPEKSALCLDHIGYLFKNAEKSEQKTILEYYTSKCSENDSDKCSYLSALYSLDTDLKDSKLKDEYLLKACELKNASACRDIAYSFESAGNRDEKKAKHYYQIACDLDDYNACLELTNIYVEGKDKAKAYELANYVSENTSFVNTIDAFGYEDSPLKERFIKRHCLWNKYDSSCKDLVEIYDKKGEYDKSNSLITYFCNTESNQDFCKILSEHYDRGLGLEKDHDKAYDLVKKVCEVSYKCSDIALDYEEGKKYEKNLKVSHELYQMLCDKNDDNSSCVKVAENYISGNGVEKNLYKARDILEKRCNLDDPNSYYICIKYATLIEKDPIADLEKSTATFKKVCENADTSITTRIRDKACLNYALNLKYGYGVEASESQSEKIFSDICKNDNYECTDFGFELFDAKEDISNLSTKQLEIGKVLCSLGKGYFCESVGEMYEKGDKIPRDLQKAGAFYKKGCDVKDYSGAACTNYGYLISSNIINVPKRNEVIFNYDTKACKKEPRLCNNLGASYANIKNDHVNATKYYRIACDADDGFACKNLAWNLLEGKGVKQDIKQGIEKLEKSCELKEKSGCFSLGKVYAIGKGVRKDLYKAKEFYGTACDLGSQDGCREFARLP
ncbi:tetratricopeptide repeat protein [Succinivibrio dextrinosolvens]|uniref:tetratricopeptide repeat protein n=1 Tax=Succinivibrio dextrinosolvens TaxID=83771 RepID=UPI00241ED253|nr:hypothetical protein [Succinivibrio dextrinosolvens]